MLLKKYYLDGISAETEENTDIPILIQIYQNTAVYNGPNTRTGIFGDNSYGFVFQFPQYLNDDIYNNYNTTLSTNFRKHYISMRNTSGKSISRKELFSDFFIFKIYDYGAQSLTSGILDFVPYVFTKDGYKIEQSRIGLIRDYASKEVYILIDKVYNKNLTADNKLKIYSGDPIKVIIEFRSLDSDVNIKLNKISDGKYSTTINTDYSFPGFDSLSSSYFDILCDISGKKYLLNSSSYLLDFSDGNDIGIIDNENNISGGELVSHQATTDKGAGYYKLVDNLQGIQDSLNKKTHNVTVTLIGANCRHDLYIRQRSSVIPSSKLCPFDITKGWFSYEGVNRVFNISKYNFTDIFQFFVFRNGIKLIPGNDYNVNYNVNTGTIESLYSSTDENNIISLTSSYEIIPRLNKLRFFDILPTGTNFDIQAYMAQNKIFKPYLNYSTNEIYLFKDGLFQKKLITSENKINISPVNYNEIIIEDFTSVDDTADYYSSSTGGTLGACEYTPLNILHNSNKMFWTKSDPTLVIEDSEDMSLYNMRDVVLYDIDNTDIAATISTNDEPYMSIDENNKIVIQNYSPISTIEDEKNELETDLLNYNNMMLNKKNIEDNLYIIKQNMLKIIENSKEPIEINNTELPPIYSCSAIYLELQNDNIFNLEVYDSANNLIKKEYEITPENKKYIHLPYYLYSYNNFKIKIENNVINKYFIIY